jgi:hypothetical protein
MTNARRRGIWLIVAKASSEMESISSALAGDF